MGFGRCKFKKKYTRTETKKSVENGNELSNVTTTTTVEEDCWCTRFNTTSPDPKFYAPCGNCNHPYEEHY